MHSLSRTGRCWRVGIVVGLPESGSWPRPPASGDPMPRQNSELGGGGEGNRCDRITVMHGHEHKISAAIQTAFDP